MGGRSRDKATGSLVALTTAVEPIDRTLRARKGQDGPHGLSPATAPLIVQRERNSFLPPPPES